MRRSILCLGVLLLAATAVWAVGQKEAAGAASSSGRGSYLAAQGIIVPADQVIVESYIASVDYHYPRPAQGIGVTLYAGHRQVAAGGQEEILQIGIQGPETGFAELAPMNLVFVIDHSGSMGEANKLDWVKRAFGVFIRTVRDKDFISLVVFASDAQVVFPSTRMDSAVKRQRFNSVVASLSPTGGTNLLGGLRLGYEQAMTNFRADYANRVLFLTDGQDNTDQVRQMLEMADSYRAIGINVSTIGVGTSFDLKLMNDLAARGGGSSRFISDMQEMEETFGAELDRMVVPAARDVGMTLLLAPGVDLLETWGYEHAISGQKITYALPTLHHRDYETVLARVRIRPSAELGTKSLAQFSLTWRDLEGTPHALGPYSIDAEVVGSDSPVSGYSDAMVLRSGTTLDFANALVEIGRLYYSKGVNPQNVQTCLELSVEMRKRLRNARLRLGDTGFDDEIGMLDNYIRALGKELALADAEASRISSDDEIVSPAPQRSLSENLDNLFQEILLEFKSRPMGTIAVSGFTMQREAQPQLVALLNEKGLVELMKTGTLKVVERERLDTVMREQKLSLSDLMDTANAISVGKLLSAQLILTGSVIEMPGSVVVFARIVNVETGEVESAAQVIVPKSPEVSSLL